jgi:hypothetical protein
MAAPAGRRQLAQPVLLHAYRFLTLGGQSKVATPAAKLNETSGHRHAQLAQRACAPRRPPRSTARGACRKRAIHAKSCQHAVGTSLDGWPA